MSANKQSHVIPQASIKEEQVKPKVYARKKIIKIRADINQLRL